MCEENSILVSQCLEFCQTLTNKCQGFNFSLSFGNSFSFYLDNRVMRLAMMARKKASPSILRRNTIRQKPFLDSENVKKTETQLNTLQKDLQCEECDLSTTSRKDLNIHTVKQHRYVEQMDGNISLNSTIIKEHDPETNTEDEPEEFVMKFNRCKKYATF